MPDCSRIASISADRPFRLDRSILRRWLKAVATTRVSVASLAGCSISVRRVMWTTADVTFGGGVKACGEISITIRASARH